MPAVIVSVNDKPVTNQDIGKLAIASDVLTKSVRDLNDSPNTAVISPFHTGDGKAVVALKLESLRRAHYIIYISVRRRPVPGVPRQCHEATSSGFCRNRSSAARFRKTRCCVELCNWRGIVGSTRST